MLWLVMLCLSDFCCVFQGENRGGEDLKGCFWWKPHSSLNVTIMFKNYNSLNMDPLRYEGGKSSNLEGPLIGCFLFLFRAASCDMNVLEPYLTIFVFMSVILNGFLQTMKYISCILPRIVSIVPLLWSTSYLPFTFLNSNHLVTQNCELWCKYF